MQKEWNYEDEWFEETNVALKIRDYLKLQGFEVLHFNDNKKDKGHDIEVRKNGKKLIIEVKGFPSDKYVDGARKGQKNRTPPNLQATHWFSDVLFAVLVAKSDKWEDNVAIGLPDFPKYKDLIERTKPILEKIGIDCYIVKRDGQVELKASQTDHKLQEAL